MQEIRAGDAASGTAPFTLEQCRRFYAEEIRAVAGLDSPELAGALARVPRERFLGPPPWQFGSGTSLHPAAYRATRDPRDLYHDVFVALQCARSLNNGQPSLIARLLAALDPTPGKRVLHVGCGTGYYTALLAECVGSSGSVVGVEIDPDLAAQAALNLAGYANVRVLHCDGASLEPGPSDVILINAAVTHPQPAWLSCLKPQGVLVLPLSVGRAPASHDALALRICRHGHYFAAEPLSILTIFPSPSQRDPAIQAQLNRAFESHEIASLRSLRIDPHDSGQNCIVHAPGFCLSGEAVATAERKESSAPAW